MSRWKSPALALIFFAGCEPEPCVKDQLLRPGDVPCVCEGVVIDSLECGAVTCTSYGPYASTTDTGCTSSTSSSTTSSR